MGRRAEAHEDVQYLAGSPARHEILATLCEEPLRPADLTDRVDVTRTTVQRVLAGFSERRWVHKRGGSYEPTVGGRRVVDRYESLLDTAEQARHLGPLATHLGSAVDELPAAAFDGEITVATDSAPLAPVDHVVERLRELETDEILVVSPIVSGVFNRAGAEIIECGIGFRMVIDESVLEQSKEAFPEALRRAHEADAVTVAVSSEQLEVGLVVVDHVVFIGAYDGDGNLRAVLESENESVVEWGRERYEGLEDRCRSLASVAEGGE